MTFGFINKNDTCDTIGSDTYDYGIESRGKCLVCGEVVTNRMDRQQVINTTRGKYGSYIHAKCNMLWLNPRFIQTSCRIKYRNGNLQML